MLPFTRFLAALASPNGASWHPEGLVLLLLDLVGDLVAEEDQVGAALDHVGDQVLVLRLQLRRVLEDVLRVLVRHLLRVVSGVLHLNAKFTNLLYWDRLRQKMVITFAENCLREQTD